MFTTVFARLIYQQRGQRVKGSPRSLKVLGTIETKNEEKKRERNDLTSLSSAKRIFSRGLILVP
jgi:hypothetical protein